MAQGPQEWSQTGNMHTLGRPVAVRDRGGGGAEVSPDKRDGTSEPPEELPLRISQGAVKRGGGVSGCSPQIHLVPAQLQAWKDWL